MCQLCHLDHDPLPMSTGLQGPGSAGFGAATAVEVSAAGPGTAALLAQSFAGGAWHFSGNRDIDAALIGSRWTDANLTFSFPTSGAFYGAGYDEGQNDFLIPFNTAQQSAARYALGLVASYTNLTFTEVSETATTQARLRFAQTTDTSVPSAQAWFPANLDQAGDVWFGRTNQPYYLTPAPGNWGQATQMHEIGHALGLKHGHQNYTNADLRYYLAPDAATPRYGSQSLPANHDGQNWSLMTYSPAPGYSGFQGDGFNQPQTYMQNDVAALQFMYGANYSYNAGDTTYRWSPTTGEMFVNGVGQGAPTANRIYRTLWDGGGNDTYDLSNYAGGISVDLAPGAFSTFSLAQVVDNLPLSATNVLAAGNVANALLHRGDLRALIENVVGTAAADVIRGNQGANVLDGGDGGADALHGGAGLDTVSHASSSRGTIIDLSAQMTCDGLVDDMLSGIENALGSAFADTIFGSGGDNVLDGGVGGADFLYGFGGIDAVSYASGLRGAIVDLSAQLTWDGLVNDVLGGIEGVLGSAFADTIFGSGGDNVLDGGVGGADFLYGFGGIDTASYASSLRGAIIDLSAQLTWDGLVNDVLGDIENATGSAFADTIYGSAGDNVLAGLAGSDTFVFFGSTGSDRLDDFDAVSADHDVMWFSGLFGSYGDVMAVATQVGTDVLITLDANNALLLSDVALASLTADDFRFA